MNIDELKSVSKNAILESAKHLSTADVDLLVHTLNEKDESIRYNAFLLLQTKSTETSLVYKFWHELDEKLESDNSYQRSIGLMLIAANVKWDKNGRFNSTINKYLGCCTDEKFIAARQAIQGLAKILDATSKYDDKIKLHLTKLSPSKYKENQQKLLNKDATKILKIISERKQNANKEKRHFLTHE